MRVVAVRHKPHNRNIPTSNGEMTQIATGKPDIRVRRKPETLLAIAGRAADLAGVIKLNLRGLAILALNGLVYLAAMNRYFARRLNPESNLVAAYVDDGYDDIVADDDTFVALSGEDEHDTSKIGNRCARLYNPATQLQHNGYGSHSRE